MTITEAQVREIVREEIATWWRSGASVSGIKAALDRDDPTLKSEESRGGVVVSDTDVLVKSQEIVVHSEQLQRPNELGGDAELLGDVRQVGQLFGHQSSPSSDLDTGSVGERPGSGTSPDPGHPAGGDF